MPSSTIVFQPYGKKTTFESGENLLEAAQRAGVKISSICGGKGSCGKCKVLVREGEENISPLSKEEKSVFSGTTFSGSYRLACQACLSGSGKVVVEIPHESMTDHQRMLLKGLERKVRLVPAVSTITVSIEKPSLSDVEGDADRLLRALKKKAGLKDLKIDYSTLKDLPNNLRKGGWTVTVTLWRNREIVSVEPGDFSKIYGLAVDIGTTKIAAYLLNLATGETAAMSSMINPQISFGEDVISRIHFIMKNEENMVKIRSVLVKAINELISENCRKVEVSGERICDVTVAGNTAMHHIFLGIVPNYISLIPYTVAMQSPMDVKARELGLDINRGAYVHLLPPIAGFVGGDAVADILATGIYEMNETVMLIDIGTNTEIVLANRGRFMSCSCASGPAFEGAHIKHGMRATTGAIEHVWIEPETWEAVYETIEDEKPRGLCGSAVVDTVAEMLKTGLLERNGRFNLSCKSPRLRLDKEPIEFVIAWKEETAIRKDISITQTDVREIQLAKAAIYTGAGILIQHMRIFPNEIRKIFLAGAFGNYVDPESARTIGMYPDVPLDRVQFVGNTAGSGARMALLSIESRETAKTIAKTVEYVELGAESNFQNEFLKATYLPHQELDRFPNVSARLRKHGEVRSQRYSSLI